MTSTEIQLLVGFSRISASNIVAQIIQPALSAQLGQPVRIVSLPGENGARAADQTASAAPDGRTLCIAVPTHVLGSLFEKKQRYDPIAGFAPVALFAKNPLVLAVSNALHVDTLHAFIALARSRPDELIYGTSAVGGGPHLAALLFCEQAGIRMQMRVYAETHTLYEDLTAGRIALTFNNTMSALPLANEGKLTLLGATGPARIPVAPDVPAVCEMALPGYQFESWVGLLAPAGTPAPVVTRINDAVSRAVESPDVRQQLLALGIEPVCEKPDYFAAHLRSELARWVPFVRNHIDAFPGVQRHRLTLP
jgi:tripartite-type tricarboxylate transporter receptor subunit TctC